MNGSNKRAGQGRTLRVIACSLALSGLVACGGGGGGGVAPPPAPQGSYRVMGTLTGLGSGQTVVLKNLGGDDLTLAANGSFAFAQAVASGHPYVVSIGTQPKKQICTVTKGSGTVGTQDVTDVLVSCGDLPELAYVVNGGVLGEDGDIATYTLDKTSGELVAATAAKPQISGRPVAIAVNPAAPFAYVVRRDVGTISAYKIDRVTGALSETSDSPFAVGTNPEHIKFDPAGKFAYVVAAGDNEVVIFSADPTTGALHKVHTVPQSGGVDDIALSANGKFAYVISRTANDMTVYSVDAASGQLTQVGQPLETGGEPLSVTIHPAGTSVYVTTSQKHIRAFRIDPKTGVPGASPQDVYESGDVPASFSISPTGVFGYAVNSGSDDVYRYRIASDGTLQGGDSVAGSIGHPVSLTFDSTGAFAYVVASSEDDIRMYRVDRESGALDEYSGGPTPSGGVQPAAMVISQP